MPDAESTEFILSKETTTELDTLIDQYEGSELFVKVLEHATQFAQDEVKRRFTEKNKKEYHNFEHIQDVERRGLQVLEVLDATEEEISLFKFVAAYHDLEQISFRMSEQPSADLATYFMRSANEVAARKGKQEIFREDVIEEAENAILGTIPEQKEISIGGVIVKTFGQETFRSLYTKTQIALALADLGTAGMEPDEYLKDGKNLFFEIFNIDSQNPTHSYENIRDKALAWFKTQSDFARGREHFTPIEIDENKHLTPEQKRRLKGQFPEENFDLSIQAADKKYQLLQRAVALVEDPQMLDPQNEELKKMYLLSIIKLSHTASILQDQEKTPKEQTLGQAPI